MEEISPEDFTIAQQNCRNTWLAKRDNELIRKTGKNISQSIAGGKFINIYPNPANEFLTIQWLGSSNQLSYKLLDINGILIAEHKQNESSKFVMPLPQNIPQGIYLLVVNDGLTSETIKVSIIK